MDEDKRELLEIYKLHAELADRISQRREGANRLYVSLLTGILILFAALFRYGTGAIPAWILVATGMLGIALSISWFIVIRSYRQLNRGKFETLIELEGKLAYPFYKREWDLLERGENIKRYWKLTVVETILPMAFGLLFFASLVAGFFIIL